MFATLNDATLALSVRAQTTLAAARSRAKLACRRIRTHTAFSEEGQGLLEYIIGIAAVLLIGAAVFALIRIIRGKYQEAGSAIDSMPVEGSW